MLEANVREILGHSVPQLRSWDDDLLIIEMTMVERPFLLDFASAYLDYPPDFPPEVIEQWERDKQEEFGDRWIDVKRIMQALDNDYGIYLLDVHPGNITFEPEDGEAK